ncbi:MAG: 30S ribosomal protein S12 methylthiotransferase RimO [Candidatus Omnitrophica bacterium]|nr:30S ribosomal protein S12 methylthiotransferase RimO [Candidatus Omnitrophota bacterium]
MVIRSKRLRYPSSGARHSLSNAKTRPDIFIVSMGCPRNLVDSEVLAGSLKSKGFRILHKLGNGNNTAAIVNTCGFIEDAKNESIDIILELADLKRQGKLAFLIVTGCLSQRYSKNLIKEISEIDGIFGSGTFFKIPEYMGEVLEGKKPVIIDRIPSFLYDHTFPRVVITPKHSVYVKVQEGCMNNCSYCVIPRLRGRFRSRDMDSLLNEISVLREKGAKEINLIGQDTTLYGIDRYKELRLAKLLKEASRIMKNRWVRILYTHPAHYTEELIGVVHDSLSICKYLDIPIQHISDKMLKRMNRHISKKNIISLIKKLRKSIPGLAIRTSVMVGFPGETDRDFDELENFVKDIKFERLGAFIYSREEGTKAFDFSEQISHAEKKSRFDRIMKAQREVSTQVNGEYMNKVKDVLIDETRPAAPGCYVGRTEHDAPEVDGMIYVRSERALKAGDLVKVKIEDTMEYDLVGSAL